MTQGEKLPQEEQHERVEMELAAIERSAVFVRSPVMRRLLRFIVRESREGRGPQIKSYTVAVDGLGRPEDFDAQQDSYPRVQVGRLRKTLESYYGAHDPVDGLRFDLRPGGYEIHFVETGRLDAADWQTSAGGLGRIRSLVAGVLFRPQTAFVFLAAMLAAASLVIMGAEGNWMAPWGPNGGIAAGDAIEDFPLLNIQPVIVSEPGGDQSVMGNLLTSRMTDAVHRSGWVRLRSFPTSRPMDGSKTEEPDFHLRSRLDRAGSNSVLLIELVDAHEGLTLWTHSFPITAEPGGGIANLDRILAVLVSSVIDPGGVVADRMLRRLPGTTPLPGYTCLLYAADFKSRRSVAAFELVQDCLKRTLKAQPRLAKGWAWAALLDQDDIDFNYSGRGPRPPTTAMEIATYAIDLDPDDAFARYALAFLQYRAGNYRQARGNVSKGYELNPYSSSLLTRFGNILFFTGDDRGLPLVRRALEIDPNPAPWFRQPLFFDAVAKGRTADAVAEAATMSELQGQGRIYLFAIRAVAAAMGGNEAVARLNWALVAKAAPYLASNPPLVFMQMGVSKPYADRCALILRKAGAVRTVMN